MIDIQNRNNIILEAFKKFSKVGYILSESTLKVINESIKCDQITVTYQSLDRILSIQYLCNLNYTSELPNQNLIECVNIDMTNKCENHESFIDHHLDIVHYFRLTLPEIYQSELALFNNSDQSGIQIKEFEKKINLYADMILSHLKEVTIGKQWVSASMTRLDGWRIQTEQGIKYYDY
ncbi:MAG: hypothetical protein ABIP95_12770 [Pelobium sp.]